MILWYLSILNISYYGDSTTSPDNLSQCFPKRCEKYSEQLCVLTGLKQLLEEFATLPLLCCDNA